MCPAVCWSIWLERNQRTFENHTELAFNVYTKAKDLFCFWAGNCKEFGDYSLEISKEGGEGFLDSLPFCSPFGVVVLGMPYPPSILYIKFSSSYQKK